MNISSTEEQDLIAATVEKMFAADTERLKGKHHGHDLPISISLWKELSENGFLSLPVATEDGGMGGSFADLAPMFDAKGRYLRSEPVLSTLVLAIGLLTGLGSSEQRARYLPTIIDGSSFIGVWLFSAAAAARNSLIARRNGQGYELSGSIDNVLGPRECEAFLLKVTTEDNRDFWTIVPKSSTGLRVQEMSLVGGGSLLSLELQGVEVALDQILDDNGTTVDVVDRVFEVATVLCCVEAVGAMAALHSLTIDYLKTRQQFGKHIGEFQVLQHAAVEMLVYLEQAKSLAKLGLISLAQDSADRWRIVSAAKIQIGHSAKFICEKAIQLHGGIGMTSEYDASRYFHRLMALSAMFGSAEFHLDKLVQVGGLFGTWQSPQFEAGRGFQ